MLRSSRLASARAAAASKAAWALRSRCIVRWPSVTPHVYSRPGLGKLAGRPGHPERSDARRAGRSRPDGRSGAPALTDQGSGVACAYVGLVVVRRTRVVGAGGVVLVLAAGRRPRGPPGRVAEHPPLCTHSAPPRAPLPGWRRLCSRRTRRAAPAPPPTSAIRHLTRCAAAAAPRSRDQRRRVRRRRRATSTPRPTSKSWTTETGPAGGPSTRSAFEPIRR
jgi:hypothetical protein